MTEPKTIIERGLTSYMKLEKERVAALKRAAAVNENTQKGGAEEPPVLQQLLLPVEGRISSPYGMRKDPFTGEMKMHEGVDFVAPQGTPIYSLHSGTVVRVTHTGGYGNRIQIRRKEDSVDIIYAHCYRLFFEVGQNVVRGTKIAEVGNTGKSKGNHLHLEVRKGVQSVHPREWPGLQIWTHSTSVVADTMASLSTAGKSLMLGNIYTGAANTVLGSLRVLRMKQVTRQQLAQASGNYARKRVALSNSKIAHEQGMENQLDVEDPAIVADVTGLLYENNAF